MTPWIAALAALGAVVEHHAAVLGVERDVLLAHRREAEGLVLDRVLLGADAEEAAVQQPHRAGEDALASQLVGGGEIRVDVLAQPRQRAREADHLLELLAVAARAPLRVVEVLLAAGGVDPGRLQVAARVGQIQTSFQAGGIRARRCARDPRAR